MKSILKKKLRKIIESIVYLFSVKSKKMLFSAEVDIYTGVYYVNGIFPLKNSFFGKHKVLRLIKNKKENLVQENKFFCSLNHGPWDNYYHWFIDSVPRIWTVIEANFKNELSIYVCDTIPDEWITPLSNLLPNNFEIVLVKKGTYVKGKKAVFLPFLSNNCSGKLPSKFLEFYLEKSLRQYNLDVSEKPNLKLYVSRKKALKRKINNDDELIEFLTYEGFLICHLEDLSIKEQANLFFNSKLILAQHGAGLTNLLYTRNADVIEVFQSRNDHLNHYRDLALEKKLKYYSLYLDGESKNDDAVLDLSLLKSILSNKI